jgi:hypothetical protein
MSVLIPHDLYRQLHLLRVTRAGCGLKMPAVGQLIREALSEYVVNVDAICTLTAKAAR